MDVPGGGEGRPGSVIGTKQAPAGLAAVVGVAAEVRGMIAVEL